MEGVANLVVNLIGKSWFNFEDNVKSLEEDLQILNSQESDINKQVRVAESSGRKKRKRQVENWLEGIKRFKSDFSAFQQREKEGGFLRLPLRGHRLAKLQQRVTSLLEQRQHFDGLVIDVSENRGELPIISKLFGEMFKQNLEKILQCLMIDNISLIGVYGMGGVGKTTLVKHIYNHLLKYPNFEVHWITVSQEFSVKRLQDQIANVIGLDISYEDDEERRASKLLRLLRHFKNTVLMLDDVREAFCLKTVGIPLGSNGCKLILTTRSSDLCDKMDCDRKFEVNTLHKNEAWDLFKYILRPRTKLDAHIEEIGKSIAKRCAGLPLGIVTMAGSMKGVMDIRQWRDALEQLKSYSKGNSELERKVFRVLQWSFSRLNKCLQDCFLHCALYCEDSETPREELISRFISAGLMDRRKTRKQEFDQGHKILNELINVCLLKETTDWRKRECVKMHDFIRDMAIWITSGESLHPVVSGDKPSFMVKAKMGLNEIPEQNEWAKDLHAVSLMYNDISEISPDVSPNCPNLSILILKHTSLKSIPNSFFSHMNRLQVLDLSYTDIEELSICVAEMENLTTLLLRGCRNLRNMPQLGKLKEIKELDISSTSISELPRGLEVLVNLRCLYMEAMMTTMRIPEGKLLGLSRLQCLKVWGYIPNTDLAALKQLEEFKGGLLSIDAYNQNNGRLNSFNIAVNESSDRDVFEIDESEEKRLVLKNCIVGDGKEADVVSLPQDLQELVVDSCFLSGTCMSDIFPRLNSSIDLRYCRIDDSFRVEFLLRTPIGCASLQSLQRLEVVRLPYFVGFIKRESEACASLPRGTFSNLRSFTICSCAKIRRLFTPSLLQNLQNLEDLLVGSCKKLEAIITEEDETEGLEFTSNGTITVVDLPKLKNLYLLDLPELKSIYNGTVMSYSISQIQVFPCLKLKRLPLSLPAVDGHLTCPINLKKICGSETWWDSLEWEDPLVKIALQPKFACLL